MKKFIVSLAIVTVLMLSSMVALAGYTSYDNDWNTKVTIEDDGSVTIALDAEKIVASQDGWSHGNAHIAIYDADQGFTSDSKMADFEDKDTPDADKQGVYPFSDAIAGSGNAGRVDASNTYNVKKGATDATTATYNFEEGKKYYVYVCSSDGTGWIWNRKPVTFTYTTETTETADFSVIAFGVASLLGCGALAISKKK